MLLKRKDWRAKKLKKLHQSKILTGKVFDSDNALYRFFLNRSFAFKNNNLPKNCRNFLRASKTYTLIRGVRKYPELKKGQNLARPLYPNQAEAALRPRTRGRFKGSWCFCI